MKVNLVRKNMTETGEEYIFQSSETLYTCNNYPLKDFCQKVIKSIGIKEFNKILNRVIEDETEKGEQK